MPPNLWVAVMLNFFGRKNDENVTLFAPVK
jgi:hypothetical protein